MGANPGNRPQFIVILTLSSLLTHALGQALPTSAANTSPSEGTSQSQPLWSYQVKPTNYVNSAASQPAHYGAGVPSIFDAFSGLNQRQGALTSSPFLSILPIILIAAGGMLLLLPLLTMMMASPFGGSFGGGFNQGFGYPQVGALSKKRSLNDQFGPKNGLSELIEHVSSTIDELSKKYSTSGNSPLLNSRRATKPTASSGSTGEASAAAPGGQQPSNHKQASASEEVVNNGNNLNIS